MTRTKIETASFQSTAQRFIHRVTMTNHSLETARNIFLLP